MRQKRELRRHERAVQIGRSDLDGNHAEFPREKARKRNLELRIGEEEDALAGEVTAMPRDRGFGPLARPCAVTASKRSGETLKRIRCGAQPFCSPFGPKREWRRNMPRAALLERARCVAQERLRQKKDGVWTDGQVGVGAAHREEMQRADAERVKQTRKLILDDIRERADHHQVRPRIRAFVRKGWDERRETRVLALREGRLDPAAGIGEHADLRSVDRATAGPRRA